MGWKRAWLLAKRLWSETRLNQWKQWHFPFIFLVFIINNKDMNSLTNYRFPNELRENNLVVEEVESFMRFTGEEARKQVAIFADHNK